MTANFPLTFNLEVAIHTILYVRQIYPADLFVRRKRYDTPVFQSRHPALNEYISGAVKAVSEELSRTKWSWLSRTRKQQPLERFIFAVENMVEVEGFNKDTSIENAMTTGMLGQYFRSFLVKLNMVESQLGQLGLGDNVSFAIVIELKDNNVPLAITNGEPPPWMPAEIQHTTYGASKSAELSMIRAVNTGVINLSLAVQESGAKLNKEKELAK
ncbi:mitotic spindle checkpoint HORMA domain-containing protein [Armillaria novae-zelandiae]|uniref:Mitotic spindle checkpoint HORMA domain-containing protein n=1 Tax=Armillaria novae-zelandiae TaxID=153914 RepID=A0AA39PCF7_9AGAR|nr:mitotic spindle checkpoint HORMA domain-containing protein [Armillaria novae-zelandiae]